MSSHSMRVGEVMTKEIITLSSDQRLHSVDDLMKAAGIRHVPVVDNDRLVGIVTQRDLFRAAMSSVLQLNGSASRGWLERIRVGDVMSPAVITALPDWPIGRAVDTMLERAVGCLPVVERGKLVGLVTEATLLRLLRRLLSGGTVSGRVP